MFELRIKFAGDISRIFYIGVKGNKFILLHGFVKKTENTPEKELDIARRRMLEYLELRSS